MRKDNSSEATTGATASDHEPLFSSVVVDSMTDVAVRGEPFPVVAGIPRVAGVLSSLRMPERSEEAADSGRDLPKSTPSRPVSMAREPDTPEPLPSDTESKSPVIAILAASAPAAPAPSDAPWTPPVLHSRGLRRNWRTPAGIVMLALTAVAVFYGTRENLRPVMPEPNAAGVTRTGNVTARTTPTSPNASRTDTAPVSPDMVHRNLKPVDDFGTTTADATFAAGGTVGSNGQSSQERSDTGTTTVPNDANIMVPLPASRAFADAPESSATAPKPALPIPPGTPTLPEYEGREEFSSEDNVALPTAVGTYPDTGYATIRMPSEPLPVYPQTGFSEIGALP